MKRIGIFLLSVLLFFTSCEKTRFPDEMTGTVWDAFCLYTDGYFSYICLNFTGPAEFNAVFIDRDSATAKYEGTYRYDPASNTVWLTFNGRSNVECKVKKKVFTYYDEDGHLYELTRNKDLDATSD